ncbi:hypothetical protein [Nocardioides speluncae]|uniref:hypothetical protein n=1 Tax=Nocardioides speluncae TaxID=2670337 RepID=UPI001379CF44|nr:hypothetical protein [Nocardioides speluncae]
MSTSRHAVDGARPVALGYIREDAPMSDTEVAEATHAMAAYAEGEGYALGTVYVERVDRTPEAFEALLASAIGEAAVAVIVTGPHRVVAIGAASTVRTQCPLDGPSIPQTGEAGALTTTRLRVRTDARLAVPTGSPRPGGPTSIHGAGAGARTGGSLPQIDLKVAAPWKEPQT